MDQHLYDLDVWEQLLPRVRYLAVDGAFVKVGFFSSVVALNLHEQQEAAKQITQVWWQREFQRVRMVD